MARLNWGINNDYALLKHVLLGKPEYYRWVEAGPLIGRTLANAHKTGARFDLQTAMAQHEQMVAIYEENGVCCHYLRPDETLHRNFFARDSSVMTPWGALICHMQLKVRRADYVTAIQFYQENNIPTSDFKLIENKAELEASNFSFPYVQKMRTGGYDGKGVQIIKSKEDLSKAFDTPSIIEEMIPFEKELSVIVARNEKGEMKVYPTVECEFNPQANLVEFLFSPANISNEIEDKACKLAIEVIDKLGMVGLLAVELFLLKDGSLLVNEVAPRPHNSGHHTIECNITSQFEQHMRSVLNLPLGSTKMVHNGVMVNLVGEENYNGSAFYEGMEDVISLEGVKVHLYGKEKTKSFRKMGHITIFDETIEKAKTKAREVQKMIKVKAL